MFKKLYYRLKKLFAKKPFKMSKEDLYTLMSSLFTQPPYDHRNGNDDVPGIWYTNSEYYPRKINGRYTKINIEGLWVTDGYLNGKFKTKKWKQETKNKIYCYLSNMDFKPFHPIGCMNCDPLTHIRRHEWVRTDGKYYWAESLPHLILQHDADISPEFANHILSKCNKITDTRRFNRFECQKLEAPNASPTHAPAMVIGMEEGQKHLDQKKMINDPDRRAELRELLDSLLLQDKEKS